jgi:hypothetical protein
MPAAAGERQDGGGIANPEPKAQGQHGDPPLEDVDVFIMRVLKASKGVAVTMYAIEAEKGAPTRKIIGQRLRYLLQDGIGYVANPPGKKRKWLLTPAGAERLARVLAV